MICQARRLLLGMRSFQLVSTHLFAQTQEAENAAQEQQGGGESAPPPVAAAIEESVGATLSKGSEGHSSESGLPSSLGDPATTISVSEEARDRKQSEKGAYEDDGQMAAKSGEEKAAAKATTASVDAASMLTYEAFSCTSCLPFSRSGEHAHTFLPRFYFCRPAWVCMGPVFAHSSWLSYIVSAPILRRLLSLSC